LICDDWVAMIDGKRGVAPSVGGRILRLKLVICVALVAFGTALVAGSASSRNAASSDALKVTPPTVHFGAARVGVVASRSITITNTSDAGVVLNAGWATDSQLDPGFGFPTGDTCLQTESQTLMPGQKCTLTFTFTAVASGEAHAKFVFSTDGFATTTGVLLDAKAID
jgi:hypothetical protein